MNNNAKKKYLEDKYRGKIRKLIRKPIFSKSFINKNGVDGTFHDVIYKVLGFTYANITSEEDEEKKMDMINRYAIASKLYWDEVYDFQNSYEIGVWANDVSRINKFFKPYDKYSEECMNYIEDFDNFYYCMNCASNSSLADTRIYSYNVDNNEYKIYLNNDEIAFVNTKYNKVGSSGDVDFINIIEKEIDIKDEKHLLDKIVVKHTLRESNLLSKNNKVIKKFSSPANVKTYVFLNKDDYKNFKSCDEYNKVLNKEK